MNYLRERVSYLKGLAEGMQISDSTNEGKLLKAIIDVLDDIAMTVDDVEEVQEQLSGQIDNIDEDLAEIERVIFDDEYDMDEEMYLSEIECPNCGQPIELDDDTVSEEDEFIQCPSCKEKIELDWDCDCEECGEAH